MSLEGADALIRKLNKFSSEMQNKHMKVAVNRGAKLVSAHAKMLVPVNDGELRQSIKTKVESTPEGIRGIIYTNKDYAPAVEFG